jgi:GH24 family phage-related lysozyme (muramidase)
MTNTAPITLEQLFRFNRGLPHQLAAIPELEADLKANGYEVAMRRDRPWFATWSQDGKQPDPIYLAPAEKIIKQWEGLSLVAYPDPATGGEPFTIGFGSTSVHGAPVRKGDKISQALADELLRSEIHHVATKLYELIPAVKQYGANQQAALISWAYNVGVSGAVAESTLRKRLLAGESAQVVIPQELPRWNKGNGKVMAGLTNRRAAEIELFMGKPPMQQQQPPVKLAPNSHFSRRITPHITIGEFALNQEARRFQHQHQVDTAAELAAFLERVRAAFGGKAVIITSGYRPPAINRSVNGASSSEHLYDAPGVGAVDFYIQGADINAVQTYCDKNFPCSVGYGAPKGFVHLGIRAGRPRVRWNY